MDDITPQEPPNVNPSAAALPFVRPADYYSAPGSKLRPLFPRWVPLGCGWAAVAFVVVMFAAGALAPGSGSLLDWVFGKMQEDVVQHFSRDVTPDQKAAFAAEMGIMRAAARDGKLKLDRTQTFLRLVTDVDADEKIDHAEADKLIAAVKDVNRSVKR